MPHSGFFSEPWQTAHDAGSVMEGLSSEKSMTPTDQSSSFFRRNSTESLKTDGASGSVFQAKVNRPSAPKEMILG